jgi:drug/metabolite transporter (DMT)-like permease
LAASLLWAFSFGLIKGHLVAYDPLAVAFLRLAVSCVLFLPWLLRRPIRGQAAATAMAIGAVQFGLMYIFYLASFRYLPAYGVALLTVFTPLYVAGLGDMMAGRFQPRHLAGAGFAVAGACVVLVQGFADAGAVAGILLLQAANLCFAGGQLAYRHWIRRPGSGWTVAGGGSSEAPLLGWMYLGAVLVTGAAGAIGADASRLSFDLDALVVLLYLGIVPTGIGFYLWNKGAARAGRGVLAVANNLKIPLAVICSWLVFGERAAYGRVLVGLVLILAGLILADVRERPDANGGPGAPEYASGQDMSDRSGPAGA